MWLKSGLRPGTGSLLASRPTGRRLRGRAGTEGKDSGGSGGWMEIGSSKRERRDEEERRKVGEKRNKMAEKRERGGRKRKRQNEGR